MPDIFSLEIPQSVENLQLPDPTLLNFYGDVENRVIWFDREIDPSFVEFQKYILKWNREDKDIPITDRIAIKCFFATPGGDLDTTISMVSLIKLSKTPIIGINMGMAYSGGLFMYQACHTRLAMAGSTFLFHKGSASGISGTQDQVDAFAAQYKRQIERVITDFAEMTSIPKATLNRKKNSEWYITAEEAVELGVAHRIIEDICEIL